MLHSMHEPGTDAQSVQNFNALEILSKFTAAARLIALHNTYRICMHVLQAKVILSFS